MSNPSDIPGVPSIVGSYYLFLLVAFATHAAVGYTLGALAFDRPLAGAVGGLVADVDFVFRIGLEAPFVHRGITHTLFAATLLAGVAAWYGSGAGSAVGLAYLSHLCIDATTPLGVPLLYPLLERNLFVDVGLSGHSTLGTLVLWGCCLGALVWQRSAAFPSSGWVTE